MDLCVIQLDRCLSHARPNRAEASNVPPQVRMTVPSAPSLFGSSRTSSAPATATELSAFASSEALDPQLQRFLEDASARLCEWLGSASKRSPLPALRLLPDAFPETQGVGADRLLDDLQQLMDGSYQPNHPGALAHLDPPPNTASIAAELICAGLNNNLLATSDFYTSAFPAEYGDVLSGVYDIKLRSGNNERFEGVFGVGIMGTDITLEGPLKKGYTGSYLINYRYSTITLMSNLGLVDRSGVTIFQDGAFKIMLPSKKLGTFSIFGLGGYSGFDMEDMSGLEAVGSPGHSAQLNNLSKDHATKSYLFNTGINHSISLSEKSYLNTSIAYSTDGINDDVQARYISPAQTGSSSYKYFEGDVSKSTYRGAVTLHYKINNRHKLQAGFKYGYFSYDYFQQLQKDTVSAQSVLANFNQQMSTLRNFISWKFQAFDNLTFITGIHQMNELYNQNRTLEPRFAMNWGLNPTVDLTLGYGKHSSMESVHNYFAKVPDDQGALTELNRNLGLLKANHYTFAIEKRFRSDLKAKLGLYYQWLYNLPVANEDTSYYATINERIDYEYVDLVNEGKGKNYGAELTIEKFFNDSYYFLINMSLFQSKYKTLENRWRNTQYNGEYMANILAGKEFFNLGKKDNQEIPMADRKARVIA